MRRIYYNGESYLRSVDTDIIPNVESITWYQDLIITSIEILDSEFANELEIYYERMITHSLMPLPLI